MDGCLLRLHPSDGKKMSKRLKNYPDPTEILNAYGADALRCACLGRGGGGRGLMGTRNGMSGCT
jgi:valyl-tRNA synthetase